MVFPQSVGTGAADRSFLLAMDRQNSVIAPGRMTIDNTKSGGMKSRDTTPKTTQRTGNHPQ
jgi:hypothetical protein